MERPVIREYQASDLDAVVKIWRRASELAHPFLTDEFLAQEREAIRDVYMPNTLAWVYEEAGSLLGFIALMGDEVGAIFVDPEHARRGVGRALMDKAAGLYPALEVDVFAANHIGRSFYDGYGFVEIGRSIHEATGQEILRLRYG